MSKRTEYVYIKLVKLSDEVVGCKIAILELLKKKKLYYWKGGTLSTSFAILTFLIQ